jgi:hypothetical protein
MDRNRSPWNWSAKRERGNERVGHDSPANDSVVDIPSAPAFPGASRGFGGGTYAAPYSGSYGGRFRTDYRASRADGSERFPRFAGHRW